MRSRTLWFILGLAPAAAAPAAPAAAQGCSQYACSAVNEIVANVGALLLLTLDGSPTVTVAPTAADIAGGHQLLSGPVAHVKSNTDWRLEVSAETPEWSAAAGARSGKPAGDLSFRVGSDGRFTPLSTAPQQVAVGTYTADTGVAFQYQANYDARKDRPGTYSLVVRYTLTTR